MSFSSNNNRPGVMPSLPEELPDMNKTDSMFADRMNKMSVNEREQAYEDLHGVSEIVNEDPEFVNKCLDEMQVALNKIREKPAYTEALSNSPSYVNGRDMMIMFLRSTSFDAAEAASKLVKYFEFKKIYFGHDLLARPIRYSDLNAADLDALKEGFVQPLPFRDKAGRAIVWVISSTGHLAMPPQNVLRALWYIYQAVLEDEETQKRGVVCVITRREDQKVNFCQNTRESLWQSAVFGTYTPFRMVGCHFCIESKAVNPLIALAQMGQPEFMRVRNRIHYGTQIEFMYTLLTFGIPVNYAPITISGVVKVKYFRQWLAQREILEKSRANGKMLSLQKVIELPGRYDVLLGRGSLMQNYSGNILFNMVIDDHRERYVQATTTYQRTQLAKEIWNLLQKQQVRFLDRNKNGWWEEVTAEAKILKKLTKALRAKKPTPDHPFENTDEAKASSSSLDPPSFLNQTGRPAFSSSCCNPTKRNRLS